MKRIAMMTTLAFSLASTGLMAAQADMTDQMHKDYAASMSGMSDAMHKGVMSKDPDVAFAAGMGAHHAGAVEMAKVELKYGKDPEMRRLAEGIIKSQEAEIGRAHV